MGLNGIIHNMANMIKRDRKFSRMAAAARQSKVYWIESIRLVGYYKFHAHNPQSRMFTYFHPECQESDAYVRLGKKARQEYEGGPLTITLRQLNKCFGFKGNDIKTVRRALDEMKILFRTTNAAETKAELLDVRMTRHRKMVDFETASRIIAYVYENQEIWP